MKTARKRILAPLGVILILAVLAVVALAVFVDAEQIKEAALKQARKGSGFDITAGPASLRLSFSGVGIRIDSLRVASPDSSQRVAIEEVDVYAKLLPLLKRRVELKDVVLHEPVIDIREPRAVPPAPEAAPPSDEAPGTLALLALESWSVKDGTYRQEGSWGELELRGLTLSGNLTWDPKSGGTGSASGEVQSGFVHGKAGRFDLPTTEAVSGFRFPASGDSVLISDAEIRSGAVKALLSGTYWKAGKGWDGVLKGRVEPVSWTDILPLIPPDSLKAIEQMDISGIFELPEIVIETVSESQESLVSGVLAFSEVAVKSAEAPLGFSEGRGTARFTPDLIVVEDGAGRIGEDPVRFTLRVDGEKRDQLRAGLKSDVKATSLSGLLPEDSQLALDTGSIAIDVTVSGTMPFEPGTLPDLRGAIELVDLSGRAKDLPLGKTRGRIRLAGRSATLEGIRGALGTSDFALDGTIADLKDPRLDFQLVSQKLNLDELLPDQNEKSVKGAGEAGDDPPAALPMSGKVTVKDLKYRTMTVNDFRADLTLSLEGLAVEKIQGNLHGGSVSGRFRAKPADDGRAWSYDGHLDLAQVGVSQVLSSFTRYGDRLEGQTLARIEMNGTASPGANPVQGLTLLADLKLKEGAFRNVDGLVSLARRLKIKEAVEERWPFRNLAGIVAIRQGRLEIDSLRVTQKQIEWSLGGSLGLDGTLDLRGTVFANRSFVTLPPEAEIVAPYVENSKGQVPIDFKLGGRFNAPTVSLDWENLLLRAAENAKTEEKEKLRKKIQETLKDPNAVDKLKKIFGKGG